MSNGEVQVGEDDVEEFDAERYVAYFHQGVLAAYRDEPHRYALETDDFEGHLTSILDGSCFRRPKMAPPGAVTAL